MYFQVLATWKMGDARLKAHLPPSEEAEAFMRRERGTEHRNQGRGCQVPLMQTSTVHSDKAGDGPVCVAPAPSRPAPCTKGSVLLEPGTCRPGACRYFIL